MQFFIFPGGSKRRERECFSLKSQNFISANFQLLPCAAFARVSNKTVQERKRMCVHRCESTENNWCSRQLVSRSLPIPQGKQDCPSARSLISASPSGLHAGFLLWSGPACVICPFSSSGPILFLSSFFLFSCLLIIFIRILCVGP